jgi:ABC-2 type transport system permease protein
MKALLFREIKTFFGSPIGYLVIALFLILNGLFLWIFEGDFNVLNSGYADLSPFFLLAPWILLFLIPAITMRSFSDEKKQGTLELLLTKPLNEVQIVMGKFGGAFVLIFLALLPTLLYVYVISKYGFPEGSFDSGSTMGSYIGLLFLITAYTSIGIFCSIFTENQIVAFISSVFICFVFYFGFEGIAPMFGALYETILALGMDYHYKSISRGVLDTRDLIYFVSVSVFFISLTVIKLKTHRN